MSNDYYNVSGGPGTGAFLASAQMRGEFDLIMEAFDKLPSEEDINSGATNSVTVTGTVNNYNATLPNIDGYAGFQIYVLRINVTNTGPSTLNINGLGTRVIVRHDNTDLQAGDLIAGRIYIFVYDDLLGKVVLISVMGTGSSSSNPTYNDVTTTNITNSGALLTGYLREKIVQIEMDVDDIFWIPWTSGAYFVGTPTAAWTAKFSEYPDIDLGNGQTIGIHLIGGADYFGELDETDYDVIRDLRDMDTPTITSSDMVIIASCWLKVASRNKILVGRLWNVDSHA
jgi:hypothetical protein